MGVTIDEIQSMVRGVTYNKSSAKFVASIYTEGIRIHLGSHSSEELAIKAVSDYRLLNGLVPAKIKEVFQILEGEVFKDIINFPGYRVSNMGRVTSVRKSKDVRLLIPHLEKSGYVTVVLVGKVGKLSTKRIHSLVAGAFLGHTYKKGGLIVDHIDNNKSNNKLSNLQLISIRENSTKDKENKFTGVTLDKVSNRYRSRITIEGKRIHLGMFNTQEEAYDAYLNKLRLINIDK